MSEIVVLTGGTGLVGRCLTKLLLEEGYTVRYLSRRKTTIPQVSVFTWDVSTGTIEDGALDQVDYIVHLAGAGIADRRWTARRKKEILESRVKSTQLLYDHCHSRGVKPKAFIASSAIGYYGGHTRDSLRTERSAPGSDFLAEVTTKWEAASDAFEEWGVRVVKLRTGVVLSLEGGALPKVAAPARLCMAAALGSGRQWVSWIHEEDLARLFLAAIRNGNWRGSYNAVAPHPVRNKTLTSEVNFWLGTCRSLRLFLPPVPAFLLRLVFGEMAIVVLGSSRVDNERLRTETYFRYAYPTLAQALEHLSKQRTR
jgi:uncharacterized protein (TIGR01777 family)